MAAANGEENGFSDFASERVALGVLKKGANPGFVGGRGKEFLFEVALVEGFLGVLVVVTAGVQLDGPAGV